MVKNFSTPNSTAVEFDPFNGLEIVRLVPTTEPQIEIWLSCLLGGDDACRAFNESISLRFQGILDETAMELALQALVRRHDSLRSVFSADGKQICVFKELPVDLLYQDISTEDNSKKEKLVNAYVKQDALHLFDLVHGPLFKIGLLKLSEQEHHLVLTAHHIIWDGWSKGVMVRDLSILYSAYTQNIFPDLPKAPLFSQYAIEQFRLIKSEKYGTIERFWLDQYKGDVPTVSLPTDFPRPAFRTFKSRRQDYLLDKDLGSAVKKLGLKAGCSYVTTLIATFEVLLYRLTGQDDIVLGLPTAGQSITGNQHLIGHCVNLLPLRSYPKAELSFLEFLKQRKQAIFDAYEYQQLTFGSLLRKLVIARDSSRVPIVPVVMNIDMSSVNGDEFYGLNYELIGNPREYENFELFLNINNSAKALILECSYNTQLFKATTIDRMMSEFEQLLKVVVANPSVLIGDIQLTNTNELFEKLTAWNDTKTDYPRDIPLHKLISQTAAEFSNKTALLFNTQSISYKILDQTANQVARYILQKGIKPGDIIGVAIDRSPEMLITLLAVMKAGAAYLPLDPDYPEERITFMLTDSSATMLITSKKYHGRLNSQATEILIEDALTESKIYTKEEPDCLVTGGDLAYVLYTSGSTGKPKGVLIEHHNLVNFLYSMLQAPGISRHDVLLAVTTISFDIAGLELYLPLIAGATIMLADTTTARDGRALVDLVKSGKVSIMQATPSTWRMMLDSGWDKLLPLKVLCGGEALSQELVDKLIGKCNELWNVYGPTETTIWSTIKKINNNDTITIGRPINNTQVYILDEFLKPVAEGIVGEIYIAGDGVAQGYLNRQELTNDRFIKNPFDKLQKGVMYRTGDLGKFLENGEIKCLGRADHQVKIRGHRIELGEIENVLGTIKAVKEAVVVAREDRPGDQRLVAYVVPQLNADLAVTQEQVQEWKQYIRLQLPDYMIPNDFVTLAKLPLTPNGKIDRKVLPKPTLNGSESRTNYVGPRTDIEELVSDIWMECLMLEKVSVFDDFFELGGHSLIAIQIMTRLEKRTGKRLPLATLFEHPTVEKLSLVLQKDDKSITWDSLVPIKPHGNKTPLYIVHGAGLHVLLFSTLVKNMDVDQPIYGLQAKGMNGIDEPLHSIEDIAAYYIDEIIKNNPDGPYALAGYSFGGIIAYEMAKQLKNKNKEVIMLAMFDTHADQHNYLEPWVKKVWNNTQFGIKRYLYTFVLLMKDVKGTINYKKESIKRRTNNLYNRLKYKENYYKVFYSNNYKVYEAIELASRNYQLTPQNITINLFRAKKRMYYMEDFEYLGWKPFALKGVNIHEIPGDHVSLFAPPNDKVFARILQKVLDDQVVVK